MESIQKPGIVCRKEPGDAKLGVSLTASFIKFEVMKLWLSLWQTSTGVLTIGKKEITNSITVPSDQLKLAR